MNNKDALDILNIFTKATSIAKNKNTKHFEGEFSETTVREILIQAFPKNKKIASSVLVRNRIANA